MKVLELNAVCDIGSTGRSVVEIADFLECKGVECYIAHSSDRHYKYEYIIGNNIEKKVHALLSRLTGWQEVYSIFSTLQFARYIKKNHFSLVNINIIHSNYVSFPILMRKLNAYGIPTVLTLHDCWFYTGKCTHYTQVNCYKWQNVCGHCPRLSKDIPSLCFDFTGSMLRQKEKLYRDMANKLYVIGVSRWIVEEAKKSILKHAKEIVSIYNWVDCEVFRPMDNRNAIRKELSLPMDTKILLGVASSWTDSKGLMDFACLAETLPDGYQIILIGNNPEGFVCPSKLEIFGPTDNVEKLAKYYNVADCFLSLSEEESFGKVIAEALACGTPVVAYNSTASPELVFKGCGYVVEKHDLVGLNEVVQKICTEGKDFYSDTCVTVARKNFNKELNIQKYYDLFKRILGE